MTDTKKKYNVVIADDHPLILMGLEQALGRIENVSIKAKEQNGLNAFNTILKLQPDIALLDIQMPEMTGIQVAEKLHIEKSRTKIVLLTMFHDLSLFEKARQVGVIGYLLKDSMLNELENCLHVVCNGEEYLSEAMNTLNTEIEKKLGPLEKLSRMEKKVFQLIGEQKTTKEIAELLFLSPKTIENHRYNICKKLEIGGGANALLKFVMDIKG